MSWVITVSTEDVQKRAAAFVAMSVALDVFDPENVPHIEPFEFTTKDDRISRALRLASEVKPATAAESTLVKGFQTTIAKLRKGRSFTKPHRTLAGKLRNIGFDTARHYYHVAGSAE